MNPQDKYTAEARQNEEGEEYTLLLAQDKQVERTQPEWDLHLFGTSISLPSSVHRGHRRIIVVEKTPLIAAAPELLAAARAVLRWAQVMNLHGTSSEPACVDMCETAIAKTEGK